MNILARFRERFAAVLLDYTDDVSPYLEQIRPSGNPKFGDYQANLAMPLAKKIGRNPRELADEIAQRVDLDDFCEPTEIAGAGFINIRLKNSWLDEQLRLAMKNERLNVGLVENPKTYVVDFSSPNVAKPMHVGHIRSTVIGDSLSRTLRYVGHRVITDNHLGDWGTQFGMIIYGFKHFVDEQAFEAEPITELGRLYREVRKLMDYHAGKASLPKMAETEERQQRLIDELEGKLEDADKPTRKKLNKEKNRLIEKSKELAEKKQAALKLVEEVESDPARLQQATDHQSINQAVLEETAKLHADDDENLALWKRFLPICMEDLHRIYDKLGVSFDHELGESFYHDQLPVVVREFVEKDLARESDGAMCVFLDDFDAPMLIQKKDGAFLYATSDLATIRYRMENWKPDAVLYVVDHRQHEHFEKLFAAARKWGYTDVELQHVAFGTVMGEDRRPFRTRAGEIVGLESLVDEAVGRALKVVEENSTNVDEEERPQVAKTVGIGALKYADLSQNRSTDYVFSYDQMLAMNGNTGPYLQYSYARNQGIFARAEISPESLRQEPSEFLLESEEERALALALLRFEEALHEVLVDYRPNQLSNYVYALSKVYSTFFSECPVIKAENEALKKSRLQLCDLTARTVKQSLQLLGIDVVDRM